MLAPVAAMGQARPWVQVGASGVAALEASSTTPGRGGLGEFRIVQPTLMLHAGAWRRFRLIATVNLEGATIPGGELALGDWGEGFVDRRHPHTWFHELMLTADDLLGARDGPGRVSLSAGKGFAPFGSDDPMVRPFVRFPVNHHLSQILERAVAIAAVRTRMAAGELGLFNGDEPERPGQWPRIGGRFGDSWAARGTVFPVEGIELQASHAEVHSPEHRPGAGTDQDKWSLSTRFARTVGRHPVYGLAEWARTSEGGGIFVFHTFLAEGAWTLGHSRLQYRFERTERPEEERVSDFRSLLPHLENSVLGASRWTVHTVGYGVDFTVQEGLVLSPLLEISYGMMRNIGGGVFDVTSLYGQDHFWSLGLGFRVAGGMAPHRMGKYGSMEDTGMELQHHGRGM